jgi:hypothetical protein
VEKHIHAIIKKLGLADEHDVSKRVTAALMLLSETGLEQGRLLSAETRSGRR